MLFCGHNINQNSNKLLKTEAQKLHIALNDQLKILNTGHKTYNVFTDLDSCPPFLGFPNKNFKTLESFRDIFPIKGKFLFLFLRLASFIASLFSFPLSVSLLSAKWSTCKTVQYQ